MATSRELLEAAERELAAAGVDSPRVDAELLLAHVTNWPRALLRLAADIPDDQGSAFTALVGSRASRVPLQHLTGTAPFRHLELEVGPGVFVPRPETELMVDLVHAHLQNVAAHGGPDPAARRPVVVDLCTGSGALSIALASEVPGSQVHAVELDPGAATWTRRNLERTAQVVARAASTVQLVVADATTVAEPGRPWSTLVGLVDIVVTNPPYVPDAAIPRQPEVRDHDPALALFGGADGLEVVRSLIGQAARLLRPGGLLVIEHADVQGEDAAGGGVPGLLRAAGDWTDITDHLDLAGLPRHCSALRRGTGLPRAEGQR